VTGPAAPPWGDDFDPARAWTLLSALREEIALERTERRTARAAADTAEAALADATARAQAAEADAAQSRVGAADAWRQLHVEQAGRRFGIGLEFLDLITGETEGEIVATAERLARSRGLIPHDAPAAPRPPVARLVPGIARQR
jgi:GNAT superfamily N-acetyltransferase